MFTEDRPGCERPGYIDPPGKYERIWIVTPAVIARHEGDSLPALAHMQLVSAP